MPVAETQVEIERWLHTDGSDLPALPKVAAELTHLIDDPETVYDRMTEVVMREPILAARVLRLVNSVYFGLSQKVTDIRHALLLLGWRTVRTVALTASVLWAFKEAPSGRFDFGRFWTHSISVAAVCRTLAKRCGSFDAETAFSLGLLHDIGKVVLARYRLEEAERVIANAEEHRLSFLESERQVLPVNHADLGAWLARRWALPQVLIEGLANHHTIPETGLDPLASAVQFANYLCTIKGITTSGSCGAAAIRREVWDTLGLSVTDLAPLIDAINKEIKTAEDLLKHT